MVFIPLQIHAIIRLNKQFFECVSWSMVINDETNSCLDAHCRYGATEP